MPIAYNRSDRNKPSEPRIRTNEYIRVPQVRLIDDTDTQLGIVATEEALRLAKEKGLDLVEVVPNSQPPVAKILDFGKYLYMQKKVAKKQKAKAKTSEVKEVRISLNIGDHDLEVKRNHAKKFLEQGHRVKTVLRYRGRENAHRDLGLKKMQEFITSLGDTVVMESPPKLLGKILTALVRPKG